MKIANAVQTARDIRKMSRMHYSTSQWSTLFFALRSRRNDANLLNFHVDYPDVPSFHFLLREIFLEEQYKFKAESESPVILDCGANIGLAVLFFKHVYPAAQISCFEADPFIASVLQKNIDQNNLQHVQVHNLMLSNEEGEHSFYVSTNVPGSLMGSSTPGRVADCREIRVRTGKLSNFILSPVDLLKLDVEGSEFDVMEDLITSGKISQISRMIIEYHHKIDGRSSCMSRFLALLEDNGFEYQISAECDPITAQGRFQDVLIGAYRSQQA